MRYLLDTDICIFLLRRHPTARARFGEHVEQGIAISVITLAELRYGAACSAKIEDNQKVISNLIAGVTVLDVTPPVARTYADIKATLRKQGNLIEDFDLLISATAISLGLTLVTNNLSHFARLPEIALEGWLT